MNHRSVKGLFLLLFLFILPLVTLACEGESEASDPIVRPVRYVQVSSSANERTRRFSGAAQAEAQSRLSFRVGGTVQSLVVAVGDEVQEGQLIAELDPTDHSLQVQEAQAAMAQAQAQQRNAQTTYARVRALYESNEASRQDLDSARTASETSSLSVRSISQRLQLARRQLEYTRLVAPAAGSVAMVAVEPSENVAPGQIVAVVQSGEQLEVSVPVPETLIARIERGDQVRVSFNALAGREFTGSVFEVGVASQGSTYPVTIQLEDTQEVRPGMAADVEFTFQRPEGETGFRVPSAAIGEDREGRFVFVVERQEDGLGTVHRRAVTVGDITSDGLLVETGLSEGEMVVTAGVSRITDGLLVRVPPSSTQPNGVDG